MFPKARLTRFIWSLTKEKSQNRNGIVRALLPEFLAVGFPLMLIKVNNPHANKANGICGRLSSSLIIYVPWHKDRKSLGGLCEANQEVLTEIILVLYQRVTMSLHI